jgi:hypothetical protein
MRQLQSILIAALVLPALLVLGAGPALADGLMSMSEPAVGTVGAQSMTGPLTLSGATAPALSITGVASGADAIVLPAGARLHLGGGTTDYLYASGPTVTATGGGFLVTAALYVNGSSGVQNGGAFNGGSLAFNDDTRWLSTTSALLESSTVATAGTDTAFMLRPLNALDTADNALDVQSSAGASLFAVSAAGNAVAAGTLWAPGTRTDSIGARGSGPLSLFGRAADGAGTVGVKIGNYNTLTTPGAKVASFCADNPTVCTTEVASIGYDGTATFTGRVSGVGVQAVAGTEPTCDESARGLIWTVAGGAGVADTVKVCAKDAADAYDWRVIY